MQHFLRLLWGVSGVFFGVYAIVQDLNIPLIVQPQLLSTLSYLSWAQVYLYLCSPQPDGRILTTVFYSASIMGGNGRGRQPFSCIPL